MSRWFRHYAGLSRDDKLVRAAVKARQPVERAVWVYGAILESAAEVNDGGRYDFDVDEAAYFLRCEPGDLSSIVDALCDLGRLDAGKVTKWGDRQFESDGSKERQQRYRDRQKASRERNGDVTPPSRDGEVTPQEAETETQSETDSNAPSVPEAARARVSFEDVLEAYPRDPGSKTETARLAFERIPEAERETVLAGAMYAAKALAKDSLKRNRSIEEGARWITELHNFLANGEWRGAAALAAKDQPSPDLEVIDVGSADFEALKRLRSPKPIFVPDSGKLTVTKAELEQARAGALH
jgi:hypothetical protein